MLVLCLSSLFYLRNTEALASARVVFLDGADLVYRFAAAPRDAWNSMQEHLHSRADLLEDNRRLQQENLVLQGKTQQVAAFTAEISRYRALLRSSQLVGHEVMVAEIISVTSDPTRHLLILDKGADDNVHVGQPLLGAEGLMGQIVDVGTHSARALLISDLTHAVPVQINRNGVRGIAEGIGDLGQLVIRHIAATTDITVGDLLVTSGLGGRFPPGYPVAVVSAVVLPAGGAFAEISAEPLARLDSGRHVLIGVASEGPAAFRPVEQ